MVHHYVLSWSICNIPVYGPKPEQLERTDSNFTLHKDATRTTDFEETPGKWGGVEFVLANVLRPCGKETLSLEEAKKLLPFWSVGFVRGSVGYLTIITVQVRRLLAQV